jgi:ABC-type Mn2+/Zn2+ transport system ATPase subunit
MALEARNLSVRRGDRLALDAISFTLQSGTLNALVGPNGAGKSTLLQVMEGNLPRVSGEIRIDGVPIPPHEARRHFALMPQRGEIAWHFPIRVREMVAL